MPKLGGIYVSVRAKTDKYKRDLAEAKTMTERSIVIMQHKIDDLNWKHAAAAAAVFGAVMAKVSLDGFRAVEKIRLSTASLASTITSFSKDAETDLSGAYQQAYEYSKDLVVEMEILNAQTVATGENLNAMVETFAQGGILLDINNKKQVEGFKAIANALALVTQGQNADIQFRQEVRALVKGEARATDQLAKLLKQKVGGELKTNIMLWKEQGVLIENVGALLTGFQEGAKDLQNTWLAVGTTLSTAYDRVLRGLFTPAYENIINLSKKATINILDNAELITNSLKLLGKIALATLPLLAVQLNAVAWLLGAAAIAMKTFYMSFLTVNAQAALLTGGLVSLKAAAGLLFAAFAGWEIGKYLYENFEVARLAGLAFVDGVIRGWIHIKFATKQVGLVIKKVWWDAIEQMRLVWADFLQIVADGVKNVPGLKKMYEPLQLSIDLIRKGLGVGVKYREESLKIAKAKKEEMEAHDGIIESMRLEAIAYGNVNKKRSEAPELIDTSPKVVLTEFEIDERNNKIKDSLDRFFKDLEETKKGIDLSGLFESVGKDEFQRDQEMFAELDRIAEEKLKIQEDFNQNYAEIGLDRFDLERLQLERHMQLYRDAGVEENRIAEMTSARNVEIARAEQQAKLQIYSDTLGGIAGTFQMLSQIQGKQGKEAFAMYKAFAMAQAVVGGAQAVIAAMAAPWPLSLVTVPMAIAGAGLQIAQIAQQQPPSFDQGGISQPGEIYQTGPIRELHIPMSGKNKVDMGGGQKPIQIILNNPVFQDLETQRQTMAQIAGVVAARVAPGAVVENYMADGPVRSMVMGGV